MAASLTATLPLATHNPLKRSLAAAGSRVHPHSATAVQHPAPPVLAALAADLLPASHVPTPSLFAANLANLGAKLSLLGYAKLRVAAAPHQPQWALAANVLATARTQDVAASMILCEAVYRAVEFGEEQAEEAIRRLQKQLPAAPQLRCIQWSPPQQEQRYVVADTGDALIVAFLGTKRPADHLVNLSLKHAPVFGRARSAAGSQPLAAAHSGYLRRAAGIPAEQLYQLARVQGKRLVLTGHSLGGAVATLCTLRLLDSMPEDLHHTLSCIGFAVPPVGNSQLAALVEAQGWQERITNYTLPEDWVPGLMGMFRRQQGAAPVATGSASSAASGKPNASPAHEWVCWGHGASCNAEAAVAAPSA